MKEKITKEQKTAAEKRVLEEKENARINEEIKSFQSAIMPFGWLDLKAAVSTALDFGKDGDWLAEQVTQYLDDCGGKLEDCDVAAVSLDALLQEARNEISEALKFDVCNDAGFYVLGNYCCSSIDYKTEDTEKLVKAFNDADEETRGALLENQVVREFLKSVEVFDDIKKEAVKNG